MQQPRIQEQVEYASLGWRFTAVLIDSAVLFMLFVLAGTVYVLVLASKGTIDPNDPAAVQAVANDLQASNWIVNVVAFGCLFIYYVLTEALFGASVGKLVLHMRVAAMDGSRPSGLSIVVRNMIRIPEAWLLYAPSAISCAVTPRRQRLGDLAARTIVVRRRAKIVTVSPYGGGAGGAPPGPPPPGAPGGHTWPPPSPQPLGATPWQPTAPPPEPGLSEALGGLKTAALAARGAHLNYLRFSEIELAVQEESNSEYSQEYVSAWYTLSDAVASLRRSLGEAVAAAGRSGTDLTTACADQPDFLHLLGELEPYFTAETDEAIHDAFLSVARAGLPREDAVQ